MPIDFCMGEVGTDVDDISDDDFDGRRRVLMIQNVLLLGLHA